MFFQLRNDGPRSHTSSTFGKLVRGKTYRVTEPEKIKKVKLAPDKFMEVVNPNTGEFDDEVSGADAKKPAGGVKLNQPKKGTKSAAVESVSDDDDRPKLPAERFATKKDAISFAKQNGLMSTIASHEKEDGKFNQSRAVKTLDAMVRKAYAEKYPAKDEAVQVAGDSEPVVELNTRT